MSSKVRKDLRNILSFKLASLQISLSDRVEENVEKVFSFLEALGRDTLVLLPEMFFCGFDYGRLEGFADTSEEVLKELRSISKERKLLMGGTVPERTERGIENRAFLLQDGEILGKRSKVKLFSPFDEDKYFVPGKENPVFETRVGRVGFLICFELRFTDMVLDLKRKSIDILLVPAQWGYARREHLRVLSKARAIELQSYVIVSDTWGEHAGTRYAGQSAIYSPWGEVLAFSEKGDTLLVAEGSLERVGEVRKSLPMD